MHFRPPPVRRYAVSIAGLAALSKVESPSPHDEQFLNRVVFSHIITSLEAYLADTLILEVKASEDIKLKLVSGDKQLIKDKFSAKDILTDPEHITKHINKHLRSLLYHNFPKIDVLFQICLGVSIFEDDEHRKFLCRAAHDRHDCVHRNGKNNEGIVRDDFTDAYVDELFVAADKIVGIINTAIMKRDFADLDVEF